MKLSDFDWAAEFDRATQSRGSDYALGGRVLAMQQVDGEGLHWQAQVKGSPSLPYRCEVLVSPMRGRQPRIRASCSCPAAPPCKHVYAVLLLAQRNHNGLRAAPAALLAPPPRGARAVATPEPLAEWEAWLRADPSPTSPAGAQIPREALRLVLQASPGSDPPGLLAGLAYWQRGKTKP
jgi:hypothetical protein